MRYEQGSRHERKRTSVAYYNDTIQVIGVSVLSHPGTSVEESSALLVATQTWRTEALQELVTHFDTHVHHAISDTLLKKRLPPLCTEYVTLLGAPAYVFAVGAALDGFASPSALADSREIACTQCVLGQYGNARERGTYATLFWTDRNSIDHYMIVTSRTQIGEVVSNILQHGFALGTTYFSDSDLETELAQSLPHVEGCGSPLLVSGPLAHALARAEYCYHRAVNVPDELYVDQRPPREYLSA